MEDHTNPLKQFFKVLQYFLNDALALTGMGVGCGNLGEHQEPISHIERAHNENQIAQ
ncbi:MAG: hypothetical protein OEM28_04010 [Nitrosopumilus sp.]|nr:hypothetical protein [Nitrosopumilus sp.]MDH3487617.1 hypothetical protein [Nitrosopumilus sp.]